MTSTHRQNLLRRTAVALATLALSLFALPAAALTVTLTDTAGSGSCTFNGMSVDPAGNVAVTCTTQFPGTTTGNGQTTGTCPPPPTGPGTFAIQLAAATLAAPAPGTTSSSSFSISRTNGTSGSLNVFFSATGNACVNGTTFVLFPDGSPTSLPANVPLTIVGSGTCVITLTNAFPGTLGNPSQATISVGTGAPPAGGTAPGGVPIVAGCQTPDATTTMYTMPDPNAPGFNLIMASGTVASIPIKAGSAYPTFAVPPGHLQESLSLGESPITYSPSTYSLDMTMSPCPGVIKNVNDACDLVGYAQQNGATFTWSNNQPYAQSSLLCPVTDPSTQQWYLNVRYHYTSCRPGANVCGFTLGTTS
jgi:hypothetical protein